MKNLSAIETEERFDRELKEKFGLVYENFKGFYPKLKESFIPLSVIGISKETFSSLKEDGIVDYEVSERSDDSEIRLNVFQYVWLKTAAAMRDLNIPPEAIRDAREYMFSEFANTLIEEKEGLLEFLKENSVYDEDKRNTYRDMLETLKSNYPDCPEQDAIYFTIIGGIIGDVLLRGENISLVLHKEDQEYFFFLFSFNMLIDFGKTTSEMLAKPNMQIPVWSFVAEFFQMGSQFEPVEILSADENCLLQAIRRRDSKELTIRFDENKKDMIIESVQDGDIMEQKAKEIRRILGLDAYSEITLKYRNDKHIYFKNKKRIK